MQAGESVGFERAFQELERWGLLLVTDARLPSVAGQAAGEPVRGSWWAHPKAHTIVRVLGRLSEHPDILVAKLVSHKLTLIHRKLWPSFWRVCSAREGWQLRELSRAGRLLLREVNGRGELRTDQLRWSRARKESVGEAARELEARLLVSSEEIHTETGAHRKRLETWERWARRRGLKPGKLSLQEAKANLEKILAEMNREFDGTGRLPWSEA